MSSAVRAGESEGCMTWLSTTRTTMSMAASSRAGVRVTSYGATRSTTTALAVERSAPAWVVSSGSSSVSAPWVAETMACRSRLSWEASSTEHDAARIAATRSVGCASKATVTSPRNRSSSCRIIASASRGLLPISL
jgi:hypothetical protein